MAGTRIYEPWDLHLTLCYLGSFPEPRRKLLQRVLQEEIRGMDAPELALTGIGAFPALDQARAVYAGVREGDERPGRLLTLQNRAWQAAYSLGWRPASHERQRKFRPHLTVARRTQSGAKMDLPRSLTSLDFSQSWLPVDVCVLESRPNHPEERYRTLAATPLVVRPG
ncbi:MAG: 2'-5' RNA ligase [Planctomycetota bacterium]|jgi:2'-5' RNA ligase